MRICLVRCPAPFLIQDKMLPPLGLMAVGTELKAAGHDVFIYDGEPGKVPLDYEYYGLGPTTPEYSDALDIMASIRMVNPTAKIIAGGAHVNLNLRDCLKDGFDCIVIGDGEYCAEQAFNTRAALIVGKEYPLDNYREIDHTLVDIKSYEYYLDDRPASPVITSRGCPFKCGFCCKNYSSVRLRSAENVQAEIRTLYNIGYRALLFLDDIFILERQRAERIFRYMHSLGIISRCLLRADLVVKYGKEFVRMMADNGCVAVGMGVESGSDKILATINKGETVGTIKEAIRMLKGAGIKVKGFFILGLPGEDASTIEDTRRFLDEMQLDDIDMKIYQPYPGSPIWDNKSAYDIHWHNGVASRNMFYKGRPREYHGNISTATLSTEEIVKNWIEMEAKYKCVLT